MAPHNIISIIHIMLNNMTKTLSTLITEIDSKRGRMTVSGR